MAFLGKARKQDLVLLAEELGQKVSDKMTIIDLKNIIIGSKDYEEEFVRAQLSVISEERVERETEEKIARQLCYESELNELRLQIESIRSNVKRTSCAEDRKNTSSNYRISIGRAGEHMRETSPAVLMAEATIPVTTPIKEENGMDDLRVVYVKVKGEQNKWRMLSWTQVPRCPWEHEMGEVKDSNMELNDLRHGVVPVSKNLVNDMLICSSDYEVLTENSQMIRNPAKLREPSKEEGIINSINSKSVCSQEVVTDLLPETQSLLNVPNGDLVAVKINGSNVQTNGQGIKESKETNFTQRILWKKGIGEPIKTYELTTVTYGTVSAPYLATRTLKQLAMDEANNFPLAAPVVLSDCYMDDILSGSESIEEVIELQHQLIEMFKTAGMHLHKWCGNLPEITSNLQEYAFLEYEETKALGIIWNPKLDCFLFRIEQQRPTSFTKRMVLSTIARIFDPLGLLGPIITWAKIFMQRLWLLELGWSDELPFKEQKEWPESIELHAFSDASEKAYGSSIYLKSISALGEVKVYLVTSKSRVSPLKQISIPRLELCGAVLAAKLMKKVKEALNLQITAVHFWSDSTIVISWIHRESRELKTFVANRVSKIHQLSSRDQWHHIASEQNPADVLSRGLLPEELRDDSLWWHGPELLQSTYSTTVIAEPTQRDGFDCELRVSERTLETSLLNSKNLDFFNHLMDLSNNYFKIIHIVSYIYRFIENCRSKVKKRGPLTTSEDDKGILRVGGRLEKASIPYSQKHPAILAKNSKLSKIYFITLHKKLFHVGPQGLLNAVRLRFWALGGRNLARKTVHTCVVCFKCKPIPSSQIMGNLPYEKNQNLAAYFTEEGIEWNFIPPRAPHMGGLWEAGIKSVKYHLKRALGRSRLTYEEFETVIIQIKPLAENNKGNSGSLEKMEYRLSEYSPTERKVDDREGQCNVWDNGNCKGGFYTSLQLAFRARR
ncbi:integrase catalytic domain-containing protein [Trichonephila clavipes]|nr:integrase catalytic domain-containing protein [Trichonephila clavipes]